MLAREGGTRLFNHPRDGILRYEQITLVPAAHPGWKLVMLLPGGLMRRCGPIATAARGTCH